MSGATGSVLERFRLDRQVAVVTGGGRGLGSAAAHALAQAGAHVVLIGRTKAPLEETATAIRAAGGSAEGRPLDVVDTTAVRSAFREIFEAQGRVDVLVNNAAIASEGVLGDVTDAGWDRVLDANLRGTFVCTQAFADLPADAERSIVNIASLVAHVGVKGQVAYVASKGGVVSMTRALALELAVKRIRVNAISPGYFATDMPAEVLGDARATEALIRKIPQRRIGEPDEIGPAVLFLASAASSFVTGAILNIDGGYTAQ